jgi:ribosomal protein S12 methylthiotransferase
VTRRKDPTVFAVTLGCPKNRVDTEFMLGDLLSSGFALVPDPEDADVLLVNTCGFLASARQEGIETLRDLADRARPGAAIVAAGCMAERFRDEIREAVPEVGLFLGPRETLSIRRLLETGHGRRAEPSCADPRLVTTPAHYAYLKVADGCSRRCAFCIIPHIKGRQRSRAADDLVAEARSLVGSGASELVLVAQDLTRWGRDLPGTPHLSDLVRRLCAEVDGLAWLRLMYLYPGEVDDRLLEAMAASGGRCLPYLDIPVQHADDGVLRAMRRATTRRKIEATLAAVRARLPGAVLRTTFLVGHPGETDAAFANLLDFATEARFDLAGVFGFSPEPGSAAAARTDPVAPRTIRTRAKRLERLLSDLATTRRAAMVGEVHEAVVEELTGRGTATGRFWFQAPEVDGAVRIEGLRKTAVGRRVRVEITGAEGADFLGRVATPVAP